MKSKTTLLVLVVLFLCVCPAFGLIEFKDGGTHDIDYEINDEVYVDYAAPGRYTTLNLLDGGCIQYELDGYENSTINILGGSVSVLAIYDSSQVNVYGGVIDSNVLSINSSQLNIYGGEIGDNLFLWDQSLIRIFGHDFAVDGQLVGFGEITSSFGCLTGTLLSGEPINNDFFRFNNDAKIVLTPEPASAAILGLGSLFFTLRRRRR